MKKVDIDTLLRIINQVLLDNDNNHEEYSPITETTLDSDFTEEDFDSILFIKLIVIIEEEFECEIPDENLLISEMNTVNKIYNVLKELESENA